MKRIFAALAVVALACPCIGSAHRIDEYLQATIVSLDVNHVRLSMRMIPGTAVADSVIAAIDDDADGVLTEDEQRRYAASVLADVAITLDALPVHAQLRSSSFPTPADLRSGQGEIHLEFAADLPPARPDRVLIVTNHHRASSSVYLMNALVPATADIQIVAQVRDAQQSTYQVDYRQVTQGSASLPVPRGDSNAATDRGAFRNLFELGMRHIAEGTDHLLFLLILLVPAPL